MSKSLNVYFSLFFLLLFPVIQISGHFIPLQEIYLYIAALVGAKYFKRNPFVSLYLLYFILFLIVVLATALIAKASINNHDLFILRNCLQAICAFFLFDRWLFVVEKNYTKEDVATFLINCFVVLSIPALIVFMQKFDIFGMRSLVQTLYKPQFFFLQADEFAQYRYTSVFKDYFTFGCYSIVLCSVMFYSALSMKMRHKQKIFIYVLLVLNYLSQFFVARTSVMIIPICLFCILLFFPNNKLRGGVGKKFSLLFLFAPVALAGVLILLSSNIVNVEWIEKGLSVIGIGAEQDSSSYDVMNKWNEAFFQYVLENPRILFSPAHSYNLTVTANPTLYTDSFYAQEVFRYGIYGILIYVIFSIKFLFIGKRRSYVIFLIGIIFMTLNYKGGNVFFMQKNSYLYSYLFTIIIFVKHVFLSSESKDANESVVPNTTTAFSRK